MTQHLSHEQLCDVLLAETDQFSDAPLYLQREHLSGCLICASELEMLRESVVRFRRSSVAYADRELTRRHLHKPFESLYQVRSRGYFSAPLSWAAAAALLLAVALPFGLHRHRPMTAPAPVAVSAPTANTESDEALLEGINQDLTTDIPSPMQPLADPTTSATEAQSADTIQRKN